MLLCMQVLGAALAVMQNVASKSWLSGHSSKTGMTGRETAFLLGSSCLFVIHATYTILSWVLVRDLPFHTAHHAALALLWLLVANCCIEAARCGHAPMRWLRPVLVLAIALYLYYVYGAMVLYLGTDLFPTSYMKSLIWACMMSFAFSTLLLVLEVQQVRHTISSCLCFCVRNPAQLVTTGQQLKQQA